MFGGRKMIRKKWRLLPLLLGMIVLLYRLITTKSITSQRTPSWIRFNHAKITQQQYPEISNDGVGDILFRYHVSGNDVGLCSTLNNALNAFLLSSVSRKRFKLHVSTSSWSYVSLKEFLQDPFDLITENSTLAQDQIPCDSTKKNSQIPNTYERLKIGPSPTTTNLCHENNIDWYKFRNLSESMEKTLGLERIFQMKSDLTQRYFWHLQEPYQRFVETFIHEHPFLREAPDRPFICIHVRAGDKILSSEMTSLFQRDYFAALGQAKDILLKSMKATIFIFSDDDMMANRVKYYITHYGNLSFTSVSSSSSSSKGQKSFYRARSPRKFQIPDFLPNVDFKVLLLRDVYQFIHDQYDDDPLAYKPSREEDLAKNTVSRGHFQTSFGLKSRDERLKTTRDMILSLSITRYCDFFIGTMSSNVARFAALIRYDKSLSSTVSLDDPWKIN